MFSASPSTSRSGARRPQYPWTTASGTPLWNVERTGSPLAIASIGTPVGLAVGTPFGSWLGTTVDWRWSFGTLSALMALTLVLVVVLVPDAPGQRAESHLPVRRVLTIPGVAIVLTVILAWMVAHNTVYTYVSAYLDAAEVRETVHGLPNLSRKALVEERKAEMAHAATLTPPPFLGTPPAGPPPQDPIGRAIVKMLGGPPPPPSPSTCSSS